MPTLYVITGPSGVGKTTISRKLSESLPNTVLIEGDDIYHQVIDGYVSPWEDNNHLPTFWKVCLNMFENYLSDGYNVIFNYVVSLGNLEDIRKKFKDYDIKFIVLMVDESTLLMRDSERPKDCQMKERCIELLNNFKKKSYDHNHILDTTDLSIDDTVNIIKLNNNFYLKKQ